MADSDFTRNTALLSGVVNTSVIPELTMSQTEEIDLGLTKIAQFTCLGILTTTDAIAIYQDGLANQVPFGIVLNHNEVTNEVKVAKDCVAVMDKLFMLDNAGTATIAPSASSTVSPEAQTEAFRLKNIKFI